jgi:CubicO group peptidase (beta-lactamase class C family)
MKPLIFALLLLSAAEVQPERLAALTEAGRDGTFKQLSSIVVAHRGAVIYEHSFDGTEGAKHDLRSAGKTIASILVGIAMDRGLIKSLDDKVVSYFPQYGPDTRGITLRQILSMSSGLACNDNDEASPGNEEKMYPQRDWDKFFFDIPLLAPIPHVPLWQYCTAGASLAGGVVQKAAGMPLHEFADQVLFSPLGITDYKWQFTPTGRANTAGGIQLRARDMIKIGQLFLDGGRYQGKQIVSKSWVDESTANQIDTEDGRGDTYGYFWWRRTYKGAARPLAADYAAGNGGQKIYVFPEAQLVVAMTGNAYGKRWAHEQNDRILEEFILPAIELK